MDSNVMEKEVKPKCFIITPIGSPADSIRRHIDGIIHAAIVPALENKYEINVAHEMDEIGSITRQVIEEIYTSELVIANLTEKNPNVMYELAFRHCLGKPVIQIAEEKTKLPFDIGTERTIMYRNDSQGVLDLKEEIINFINKLDFNKRNQGPIYDSLRAINYERNIFERIDKSKESVEEKDVMKLMLQKITDINNKIESIDLKNKSSKFGSNIKTDDSEIIITLTLSEKINQSFNSISKILLEKYRRIVKTDYDNNSLIIGTLYYEDSVITQIISDTKKMLEEIGIKIINTMVKKRG